MKNYITYIFYNLAYLAISVYLLFFAHVYLNTFLIPDSLRWKNGQLKNDLTFFATFQSIILILECLILFLIIKQVNKWYLNYKAQNINKSLIRRWSSVVYISAIIFFSAAIIIGSYT